MVGVVVLSASGPIRKAGEGGGGGFAVRFRSDTKSEGGGGGGGCRTLQTGLNNILYIYQTPPKQHLK